MLSKHIEHVIKGCWYLLARHPSAAAILSVVASGAQADGTPNLEVRLSFCASVERYQTLDCYDPLRDLAEQEMVTAYLAAKNVMAESDRLEPKGILAVERLQNAQIAFEEYRELHCGLPNFLENGLSFESTLMDQAMCMTELTVLRIDQLVGLSSLTQD